MLKTNRDITAEECREIIDILNLKSYEAQKSAAMWRPEYLVRAIYY